MPTAATLADVGRLALALPGATEGRRHGHLAWSVNQKAFVWERPFGKADLRRFGEATPPSGAIVAVRVDDLIEKEAVLASSSGAIFTIPHFDGYAAVLIQLQTVPESVLSEAVVDAWLACAPAAAVAAYLARTSR